MCNHYWFWKEIASDLTDSYMNYVEVESLVIRLIYILLEPAIKKDETTITLLFWYTWFKIDVLNNHWLTLYKKYGWSFKVLSCPSISKNNHDIWPTASILSPLVLSSILVSSGTFFNGKKKKLFLSKLMNLEASMSQKPLKNPSI